MSLKIDATGLHCPLPVLRVQRALETLECGAIVELHATDPMSKIDVPHFCQQSGHQLIGQSEALSKKGDPLFMFKIRRG